MKFHVQNPWTKSPSLMVHLTVEELQQLEGALAQIKELYIQYCDSTRHTLTSNQEHVLNELRLLLEQAGKTERPHGIKGCTP